LSIQSLYGSLELAIGLTIFGGDSHGMITGSAGVVPFLGFGDQAVTELGGGHENWIEIYGWSRPPGCGRY